MPLTVDTSRFEDLQGAAQRMEEELGPLDVWVNVAFTSVFAPFTQTAPEEFERVTEVIHLGYVHGTRTALEVMLPRDRGTMVQVGTAPVHRGIPPQTAYRGARHAVQGCHDSPRCELLHDRSNVRVTMVQMPAVNTPRFSRALSRLPRHAQPIRQPEVAARTVLFATDHPQRREYRVGGSTTAALIANKFAPGLLDRCLARTGSTSQQMQKPPAPDRAAICGSPPTTGPATTAGPMGPMASSTTRPPNAVTGCGLRSTTACSAPQARSRPRPPAWPCARPTVDRTVVAGRE